MTSLRACSLKITRVEARALLQSDQVILCNRLDENKYFNVNMVTEAQISLPSV